MVRSMKECGSPIADGRHQELLRGDPKLPEPLEQIR
uniref:Uncharacterized protein n=1 Tax=Brassica oleracea TaxID=3712 RepID=A0A3P6CJ35_BRAOL|nr:unnamed protein product [Brassica oleracea]